MRISTHIVAEICDIKFIYDQIKFSLLVISCISILSSRILTRNSTALCAVSNIRVDGIYFFPTNTNKQKKVFK